MGAVHDHGTRAKKHCRGGIEHRKAGVADEPIRPGTIRGDVAGQRREHHQAGDDESEVPERIDRFSEESTVDPLTPSRDLPDGLLVLGWCSPSVDSYYAEHDRERAEGEHGDLQRTVGRGHLPTIPAPT